MPKQALDDDYALDVDRTEQLLAWVRQIATSGAEPLAIARQLARRLGGQWRDGAAEFGFWAPEVQEAAAADGAIWLELLRPLAPIDWSLLVQAVPFARGRIPLQRAGDYLWAVVSGLQPGRRTAVGDFYRVVYQGADGRWQAHHDPLAASLPFGAFAPAELYDLDSLHAGRGDTAYFQALTGTPEADGIPRLGPPVNILQIHANTGSAEGTLAGVTRIYQAIAAKLRQGQPLSPEEQNYAGYDAIQLMPIEPTIEYEGGVGFWRETVEADAERLDVTLHRPDMTNWGYDVVIAGSAATNPAVLGSRRPDELIDLISTLHNFPGRPIRLILDIVYGHADNQALPLLNQHYFAGANMYGQNLNYGHPVVRAILLEMQRRKHNYGIDGVRVDGAQDFKVWNPASQQMEHDDDYLKEMSAVVQEVAGGRYRPWMIFEDGRPWPRDDWELASSYREVIKEQPHVFQWAPLTFAHNTPFLFTFWITRWWRIVETMHLGSHWITGCANHDTLRRGTQVDPDARVNTRLGQSRPEILRNAYDNPAANLLAYAMMPGVPMEFINALMRAPWSFIRNTDDRYGVKVVAEEERFLDWAVSETDYAASGNFPRLKALGFASWDALRRFMAALNHSVALTSYDLPQMAALLNSLAPPLTGPQLTPDALKTIGRAWMDDLHAYCNVANWAARLDPERTAFNLAVREFRRARPWLMADLGPEDGFHHLQPAAGTVLFYGRRHGPDGQQLLFVANMEGEPKTITPVDLPGLGGLPQDGWRLALVVPGVVAGSALAPVTLHDSQGVVFVRP